MRILHITDSHGTVKAPDSRTDLYYLTFLRKFAEITYLVKLYKLDMIIHTGDLFHTSRVSNKFMGQLAEIIKGYGVPMYVVPGNHDIDGYTIDTIDQTSLGLLSKTGVVTLLTRDYPLKITAKSGNDSFSIGISGQEYYKDIDKGNPNDFEMQQSLADINILACHSYIADTPQHPNIRCTYPKDIITDADIILTGHYHRQFEMQVGDTSYYNPGSMLRVEMNDYNKKHMPTYGVLDITLENGDVVYDYKFHEFKIAKPGSEVFDFNTQTIVKQHQITIDNFKNSITNSMQSINANLGATPFDTVRNVGIDYVMQNNMDAAYASKLSASIAAIYGQASQEVIDEDVISTKGFIPAKAPVYLEEVEMENYMSHEHTLVKFVKGLNIIIGESNVGKTTVFRLIKWVVDNDPLGTDFIMTGKKYVKGILRFSNGTIIERYRTLKDTGYYKVTYFDDVSGQLVTNEFQGFTNNVPIEVINAHQMPKIAITKNIETHLNVMSQLESPFLITDNTNEKAAAIGRITGTNIIDRAIKNNTSEIAVDNKMLKSLKQEKLSVESEMQGVPINAIKNLYSFYNQCKNDINSLTVNVTKYEDIKQRSDMIMNLINQYQNTVKQKESVVANKPTLELAESKYNEVNHLITVKNAYENYKTLIDSTKSNINNYKKVVKNKKTLDNCDEAIQKMRLTLNLYSRFNETYNLLIEMKQKCIRLEQTINNKTDLQDKENAITDINKLIALRNSIASVQQQIDNTKQTISNQQTNLKTLKDRVLDTENEMKSFVLSAGKCPCCGQDITESNVNEVIKNFSV